MKRPTFEEALRAWRETDSDTRKLIVEAIRSDAEGARYEHNFPWYEGASAAADLLDLLISEGFGGT